MHGAGFFADVGLLLFSGKLPQTPLFEASKETKDDVRSIFIKSRIGEYLNLLPIIFVNSGVPLSNGVDFEFHLG